MKTITIEDSLKKTNIRYFKDSLKKDVVEYFREKLKDFDMSINQALANNENEEYYKGLINNFLRDNFYSDAKYDINTKGNIDSAIRENNNLICIIEAKTPNNTGEMISHDNINKKAMHELVLYYLEETRDCSGQRIKIKPNAQIKNLIATNSFDWYIISSQSIEKFISGELENYYYQFKNGKFVSNKNEIMYQKIELELRNYNQELMEFVYFNIKDYYRKSNRDIGYLYKIFSRYFLLNDKYYSIKNVHVLNSKFYQELLYIFGLTEYKDNNKKLIKLDESIINSIGYQTYKKYIDYEDKTPKESYELTFDSIIIWMNRLLFIKLFESQLINFNSNDKNYHILDNDKIKNFDDLEKLFFSILGKRQEERQNIDFYNRFEAIPYLNSALFERQDIERDGIAIHELDNSPLLIKNDSILKSKQYDKLPLIEYIINFLNSYDFGLVSDEDETTLKGKDIIDTAVLGLIFEKINGYKDGSVYTPSTITEYIAKESVEFNVIKKLNKELHWNCKNIDELIFKVKDNSSQELYKKINELINSITYCDPAVGSGHFLVSILNKIIAIKYQLGVLLNHSTGYPIRDYNIYIDDDVLIVEDAEGKPFRYNKSSINSQQLQETLFYEKKHIIEKCIFGVDLNDKAVQICRLRLWIELLKSAFYKDGVMQTLPNIDINIKTGNSCISRIPFDVNSKDTLGKKLNINGHTKIIADMKKQYELYISTDDKTLKKDIVNKLNELDRTYIHPILQGSFDEKENAKNDQINKQFKGSLEWAIQFPEILDNEGRFLGFDCIIGNPPYISMEALPDDSPRYKKMNYEVYESNVDIYCLFIELAKKIVKNDGLISYITSNKWMRAGYGQKTRKLLSTKMNPIKLINFGGLKVFSEAQVDTNILFIENNKNYESTSAVKTNENCLGYLEKYIDENSKPIKFTDENWIVLSNMDEDIKNKIITKGKSLNEWDLKINRGILTGLNDAFIIDTETKNELINLDSNIENIIKPLVRGRDIKKYNLNFANKWLICTHNGYNGTSRVNVDEYPVLIDYFNKYEKELTKRKDKGETIYNLRNCAYMENFEKEKIIYPETTLGAYFYYDNNNLYLDKTAYMITGKHLKYIMGTLSSNLFEYAYKNIFSNIELGSNGYQYNKAALLKVPIIYPNLEIENKINQIVDNILSNNNKDIYINELNKTIYELYDISSEEIKYIDKIEGEEQKDD